MRYYKFAFLLLFLYSNFAVSQTKISIQGVVKDSLTKECLFYANIALLNLKDSSLIKGVVTNEKGWFELSDISKGSYLLRVSYVGYASAFIPIQCNGEIKKMELDTIQLKSLSTSLGGITIIDKKPVYEFDGEKMMYNVSQDPVIQTGTLSDALQNAPGVEVDIEGNITLRGVSSVEIWINNKPSKLTAENLKTYIQQLPANTLERIEVITNPSAKYASEKNGGIINVITVSKIKKNSFISFGANASTKPMISPWISYAWANEKFSVNLYVNGNYMKNKTLANGYSLSFNDEMDTSSFKSYSNESNSNSYSGNCFLNLSYSIDSMNYISLSSNAYGGMSGNKYQNESYRKEYLPLETIYNYTINSSNSSNYGSFFGDLFYHHKFNNEGHTIRAGFGGDFSDNTSFNNYNRNYHIQNEYDKNKESSNEGGDFGFDAHVDYTIPYSKNGELSMGVSGNYNQSKGVSYEDTLVPGTTIYNFDTIRFKDNLSFENSFQSYLSVRQSFGNFTMNVGCRFQFKQIDYQIINSPKYNIKVNYPGLFPSIHLSYKTKTMHNFRLSYTRRINYPNENQICTFIDYDEESFSTGNPLLESAYTHAVDGGWTKYFKTIGDIGVSGYFRYTKDEINTLTDVVYSDFFGRYVNYSMPVNSGSGYQTGGDFRFNYRLKSFMNIRFYANVYQSHTETMFDYPTTSLRKDTLIITNNFTYSFRLNYWAKLFKILEINASANYRSPTKSLYIENKATYSIDCGLRADFFKRKLSVFVNVRDIFNWNKQEVNTESLYYKAYSSTKYNSRYISAGFTLRFGKIELENQSKNGQMTE